MRGLPHRLLLATLLGVGLVRSAGATGAGGADLPVRLLSPQEGAVLEVGATVTLKWAPLSGLSWREWEEWEAFLSIDGGTTYPARITPHLERSLREIRFKVPDLPTRNARLLLRLGDERRELSFELPQRFAIALPRRSAVPQTPLDLRRRVWHRGEPARPGDPGVLAWVEGRRNGGGTVEVVAAEPPRALPGLAIPSGEPELSAVAVEPPPSGVPAAAVSAHLAPPARTAVAVRTRGALLRSVPILLLIQRQNE